MVEVEKSLGKLAEEINAEHRACEAALRSGLRHAVRAGELLTEAKEQVKHGEWGTWLSANFGGSERTAQAYMRVWREMPKLEGANPRFAHPRLLLASLVFLYPKEAPCIPQRGAQAPYAPECVE
jgi:predicted transcriptional regulator